VLRIPTQVESCASNCASPGSVWCAAPVQPEGRSDDLRTIVASVAWLAGLGPVTARLLDAAAPVCVALDAAPELVALDWPAPAEDAAPVDDAAPVEPPDVAAPEFTAVVAPPSEAPEAPGPEAATCFGEPEHADNTQANPTPAASRPQLERVMPWSLSGRLTWR
jgi:hypothetical protein